MWEDDHEEQRRWMRKRAEKARRKREKEASRQGREGDGERVKVMGGGLK
jgi:hypothetical protein